MSDARVIEDIEIPALICQRGAWFYALPTIAELILDYPAYDPSFDAEVVGNRFRGGLAVVGVTDGFAFLAALDSVVYPLASYGQFVAVNSESARPQVVVNFDEAQLTSGYFDRAIESQCGEGWTGVFADPLDVLPSSVLGVLSSGESTT